MDDKCNRDGLSVRRASKWGLTSNEFLFWLVFTTAIPGGLLLIRFWNSPSLSAENAAVRFEKLDNDRPRAVPAPYRLDLNRATARELELLPGVGPTRAQRILELRTKRGGFRSLDDLLDIKGMTPAFLERLAPLVEIKPL
jgi:competence ComEA-like helix-hairpin-helix protein